MEKKDLKKYEYTKKLSNILNMDEINRVHRAAKNKDKKEIIKWASQYDQYVNDKYYEIYRDEYLGWLFQTLKDIDVAVCYTLHFSEATKFGAKRIKSFMDDINVIMKGFYNGEFKREDYIEMLRKDNIKFLGNFVEKGEKK